MRKRPRRPVFYTVHSMNDGTVMWACPVRKPIRTGQRMDADHVCNERRGSYVGSFTPEDDSRFRFFDIMTNRLNMRRSIRELVLPELAALQAEVAGLRGEVEKLVALLGNRGEQG